jgi:hypothetical protein
LSEALAETVMGPETVAPALGAVMETVGGVVSVLAKVAVIDCAAVIVSVQEPIPEQAPLHPEKVDPPAGVALKVTTVPAE